MLKTVGRNIRTFFRWTTGVRQILDEGRQREQNLIYGQRKALFALGNSIRYSIEALPELQRSITYQRTAEIVRLLAPMDIASVAFVRVGRDYDGGYIMVDAFSPVPDAAYSLGIADDTSWDIGIADRGIDVYMYDHTIQELPTGHPRFHFFRTGICGVRHDDRPWLKTLETLIAENGHVASNSLLLKMDIEGYEWSVLSASSDLLLNQFSQIVVEFHGLACVYDSVRFREVRDCLVKLNRTHQCVHVHANGHEIPVWIGDQVLPDLLEVTLVRRSDYQERFLPCSRSFPTDLDQCSSPGWPDIYLGRFQAK